MGLNAFIKDEIVGCRTDQTPVADHIDQVLLQRLAQGDTTAFWEVWARYRQELLTHYCLRWMGNHREDAEDAMSSASLKAYVHLSANATDITNIKGWLVRLLHNHCMDIRRSRKWHTRVMTYTENLSTAGEPTNVPIPNTPEQQVLQGELQQTIHNAINNLPRRLREPSRLRLFHGIPYNDIAIELNLCSATVRKRLQHAREMLKPLLRAYQADTDGLFDAAAHSRHATARRQPLQNAPAQADAYEIPVQRVAMRVVHVRMSIGIEHHLPIALDHVPTRQHQKLATLRAYIDRHPMGLKKRLALANVLYTMGDWDEAIAIYQDAAQRQPRCLKTWLRLGEMLHCLQRYTEAISAYNSALPWARHDATRHHLQGQIALCQQHGDAAVAAFEIAVALEPDNAAHGHALGLALLHTNRPQLALKAYDDVLQRHPDDVVALTYSADALQAVKRGHEAQQRLCRALGLDPKNVPALKRLIDYRLDQGLVQGTEGHHTRTLLRRALRLAPNAPDLHALGLRFHIALPHAAWDPWQGSTHTRPLVKALQ